MKKLPLIKLITSMVIFGTIGLFVRYIEAERGFIACVRGIVGALFLMLVLLISRKKPSFEAIKRNLPVLLLSGIAIGVNWILLFQSYSYTTIATSTLCYYMAPVFVIVASPFVLKAKVPLKKWICVIIALLGMLFVSGVVDGGGIEPSEATGILLALGAALLYATVTLLNKKLVDISSYDMTIVQLIVAGVSVFPYTLIAENNDPASFTWLPVLMLLVVGVIHTGLAYTMFFSSIQELNTETVAIFSYLDPIVAVLLSLFIGETMTPFMALGAVLIIISLLASEIDLGKIFGKRKNTETDSNADANNFPAK